MQKVLGPGHAAVPVPQHHRSPARHGAEPGIMPKKEVIAFFSSFCLWDLAFDAAVHPFPLLGPN